ncbi:uncharacterized protein LOC142557114 isoform X3 [Dermacentor variabilis]|uniref:uncharacterized protein LOC142557114 isoform X3 n=1 Tax=Dermacentor variabilis TaxID=34621 RepID=UPI003F5C357E
MENKGLSPVGAQEQYKLLVSMRGRLHSCRLCHYVTEYKSHMGKHLRTHTGERPYKCHICPSTFTQSGHLNEHVRSHIGERPFKCHLCPCRFIQRGAMTRHVRSHTSHDVLVIFEIATCIAQVAYTWTIMEILECTCVCKCSLLWAICPVTCLHHH